MENSGSSERIGDNINRRSRSGSTSVTALSLSGRLRAASGK